MLISEIVSKTLTTDVSKRRRRHRVHIGVDDVLDGRIDIVEFYPFLSGPSASKWDTFTEADISVDEGADITIGEGVKLFVTLRLGNHLTVYLTPEQAIKLRAELEQVEIPQPQPTGLRRIIEECAGKPIEP